MEMKLRYKESRTETILKGWEVCPLGDVVTKVGSGLTPTGGEKVYKKEGRPFLRSQNVGWGHLLFDDIAFIDEETHRSFLATEIKLDDVLLNITGASIGRSAVADNRLLGGNVNQHVCIIRTDASKLNPYYLNFFLLSGSGQKQIESFQAGGNRQGLNFGQIRSFQILLPTPSEQHAIATALSDVDALITSLDKLIAKKRDIKQATMQQLLTGKTRLPGFSEEWEVKKVGEIFQFLNTANNSRSDLSENGEIKYIHYGDIHMKWRSFLDCSSDELPLIQRDKVRNVPFLEDGDLVMADASEDYEGVGISVEVKNATGRKVVAGLHTFLLRGNKEVLADAFKGYLQYIPVVKDSLRKAATGISVYGISKNNVKNISICLPDITEQQAIAVVLSDMDAEIVSLEQKRDKTRALKQGIMQELLTGKTRLL